MASDASREIPALICELCRHFYSLGWASGTGGGISVREGERIYMAPSGVQKERILPGDVFVLDGGRLDEAVVVEAAADPALKMSECTPLFYNAYRDRDAGAVLHSHSIWAVLAAKIASPEGQPGVIEVSGLEMQKGLRGKGCFDTVRIPIIANTAREAQLTDTMAEAMRAHPDVDAVVVAGHGIYVWGRSWAHAKTQAECYDYLLRAFVELSRLGLATGGVSRDTAPDRGGAPHGPDSPCS